MLVFKAAFPLLALLLVAYFAIESLGMAISLITGAAALLLMAIAGRYWQGGRGAVMSVPDIVRKAPWQIVLFSIGMYLVVYGLGNAGLTAYGAQVLGWLGQQHAVIATLGTGFLSAIVASIMNNMPTVMINALAIAETTTSEPIREALIYANVIGSDLGPKITPIGSLATLLWLHVLSQKGVKISWGTYFKIGILLTVPTLLATLVGLYVWLSFIQ